MRKIMYYMKEEGYNKSEKEREEKQCKKEINIIETIGEGEKRKRYERKTARERERD
jgi:hypothetical protein